MLTYGTAREAILVSPSPTDHDEASALSGRGAGQEGNTTSETDDEFTQGGKKTPKQTVEAKQEKGNEAEKT